MIKNILKLNEDFYFSILKNYTAQLIGFIIVIFNQIFLVPIFIENWGLSKYSDWVTISALSNLFIMSNLGINQASNNLFCFSYQNDDFKICKKIIHNSIIFIFILFVLVVGIVLICNLFVNFNVFLNINEFSENETFNIFLFLLFNIFIKMFSSVFSGIYRATSNSHINAYIDNIVVLLEVVILLLAVNYYFDVFFLSFVYNVPVISGTIYRLVQSKKWFNFGDLYNLKFDKLIFKKIVEPSLGFIAIPLGQTLNNQGLVLIVKTVLGNEALVSFTTTRTLVNLVRSVTNIFSNSASPEISNLYGKRQVNKIEELYIKILVAVLVSTFIIITILYFYGSYIYVLWLKNTVFFNKDFFTLMLFFLFISAFSSVISTILYSTNLHKNFSILFLGLQFILVFISYFLLSTSNELNVVAILLIIFESILLVYSIRVLRSSLFKSNLL